MLSLFPSVFPAQGPLRGSVFSIWIGFGCFLGRDPLRACLRWLRPSTASLVSLLVGNLQGGVAGLFSTLRMMCPYHRRCVSLIFFSIGAALSRFPTSSLVTKFKRIESHKYWGTVILFLSATLPFLHYAASFSPIFVLIDETRSLSNDLHEKPIPCQ